MDKSGVETNLDCIRKPYSAPQIIIEFDLEASAGSVPGDPHYSNPFGENIYNPWELP